MMESKTISLIDDANGVIEALKGTEDMTTASELLSMVSSLSQEIHKNYYKLEIGKEKAQMFNLMQKLADCVVYTRNRFGFETL